jgi:very-short-patch-repair endonuclease
MPEEYACWECGKMVKREYEMPRRAFCVECRENHEVRHKEMTAEYASLKIKLMHERAINSMERSGVMMHEYKEAADKVIEAALSDTEKFMSSDEIIAAIILLEYGYQFGINYKVGKYRVDFYIPEIKVCVEVDGHLHEFKTVHDSNRDIDIRNELGREWEIIRIPTKYIESQPELLPIAIEKLADEKRKIRNQNGGYMPETYSMREKSHYAKLAGYKTQRVKKQ